LAGVPPHPRRTAAQQERRAATDTDHSPVERSPGVVAHVPGHLGHVEVLAGERVVLVPVRVAVQQDHGHRGMPSPVKGKLATRMRGELATNRGAERLTESDHAAIVTATPLLRAL
jgi:hypothetical protein